MAAPILPAVRPVDHFKFCPRCGAPRSGEPAIPYQCAGCGFVFFFNPTVAAAVIITRPDGGVLFITRSKEPAKGMLAFPGGFIDIGERAEDGLRREVREEVGLQIDEPTLLCTCANDYPYRGVNYPVLDLLFTATRVGNDAGQCLDGVARVEWLDPDTVAATDLAFPSLRAGLAAYLRR